MTMGDESLFASLAMPVVLIPILEKLEKRDYGAAQALKAALIKAENQHPGLAYELIKAILTRAELNGRIDLMESLLRLEASNNSLEYQVARNEEAFQTLNTCSVQLKKILSRIPDEIYDRKKFLETIKEIAGAIKQLLDSVHAVIELVGGQHKQALEERKREFVKYSKRFSNTLKVYFKENEKHQVFHSANHLINQTNQVMRCVKEACQ